MVATTTLSAAPAKQARKVGAGQYDERHYDVHAGLFASVVGKFDVNLKTGRYVADAKPLFTTTDSPKGVAIRAYVYDRGTMDSITIGSGPWKNGKVYLEGTLSKDKLDWLSKGARAQPSSYRR
jgi:hypothetical protein